MNDKQYCQHAKFLLVEEIALIDNFCDLHYGRCTIIGKIAPDAKHQDRYYVENIRLTNLSLQYSLPEGTVRLRIIPSSVRKCISLGKVCEIVGEVIIYDNVDAKSNVPPATARDALLHEDKYRDQRYEPAIKVQLLREVRKGAELIEANLRLRLSSCLRNLKSQIQQPNLKYI